MDLRGRVPESWDCIDCGVNTAPGLLNRLEFEQALARDVEDKGIEMRITEESEVYTVSPKVWQAAGMQPYGGCLCIGCLERRLGRALTRKDFLRRHIFNKTPGTQRLMARRAWEP